MSHIDTNDSNTDGSLCDDLDLQCVQSLVGGGEEKQLEYIDLDGFYLN